MPLKVLFVSSEVSPFRKTGGLGDVAGALPKALKARGVDVRVVMPLYRGIRGDELEPLEPLEGVLEVPMYYGTARAAVRISSLPGSGVPIYFLEHHGYFDRPELYGAEGGAYSDNLERFTFFSRAALELAIALGFEPDVVHAHDWQTALIPVYANTLYREAPLRRAATLFTVHNLAFQGVFDGGGLFVTGLGREHYNPGELEHFGAMNLMKGALVHSTLLSTVSPTYASEIQRPEHGAGLDGVIAARSADLHGILNGIDTDRWDPETDRHLPARYGAKDLAGKAVCKRELQREMGLPERAKTPLFGAVSRLTPQKGFDLLAQAMKRLLGWDLSIVLLGSGDSDAEEFFTALSRARGDKFRARIGFDDGLAHRIEAGCDFFLMPSRFEPCGLNQMYSLRYGTLPIVHATGGLADTVANYDDATGEGTGFVIRRLDAKSLGDTVGWAVSAYFERPRDVETLRRRGMELDFSWTRAAERYERLYRDAYLRKNGVAVS